MANVKRSLFGFLILNTVSIVEKPFSIEDHLLTTVQDLRGEEFF
jgi:hypothetical protein